MSKPNEPIRLLRTLPDPQVCRTRCLGPKLAQCLVDQPDQCAFAFRAGIVTLCEHPDCIIFVDVPQRIAA